MNLCKLLIATVTRGRDRYEPARCPPKSIPSQERYRPVSNGPLKGMKAMAMQEDKTDISQRDATKRQCRYKNDESLRDTKVSGKQ